MKFKTIKALSLAIVICWIISGCASVNVNYLDIKSSVIDVSDAQINQYSVAKVDIGETPGNFGVSVSVKSQDVVSALKKNLQQYDLLEQSVGVGNYQIALDMTFLRSGLSDIRVQSIGRYEIKNLLSDATSVLLVDEVYTAEVSKDLFGKAFSAGLTSAIFTAGVASGLGVDADIANSLATDVGTASMISLDEKNTVKDLTAKDKSILRKLGYAKEGVPITAFDGSKRLSRAYEGSIRLNMASFIDKLRAFKLP